MSNTVLLISTLDTKADETLYFRRCIEEGGASVVLMDLSMGSPTGHASEIPPEIVAAAGNWDIENVRRSRERATIIEVMTAGATRIACRLAREGRIQAVAGIGGSTGSLMATDVMRCLPFGLPKMMVSSTAALPGLATRYIDTGDLMLFHSVVEISGLSPLLKSVIERAAAAACALAAVPAVNPEEAKAGGRPLVAMTMFGPCERCAHELRLKLEARGFDVIGYSAAGVCDRAMEEMILQGYFSGVIDLAPGGVGEYIMGGMRSAGPHRLEAAGKMGLPQVIAPSGVNLMSPRKSRYKPGWEKRRKFDFDKLRTFLRLDPEELVEVARVFAKKINQSRGQVKVLIPTRGWANIDREGSPVYCPMEDCVFIEELKKSLRTGVEVIEVEANLEDDRFIDQVADTFSSMF